MGEYAGGRSLRLARTAEGGTRDYVLGTDDAEVDRLGRQHEAWGPTVRAAWTRAGIGRGDRVIDIGAGPGWAALELATLVGPTGHVTAVERSDRFVAHGRHVAARQGFTNVSFHELDLMHDIPPNGPHDVAWCRWVASFVSSPAALVERLAEVVRPDGVAVFFEYADYASWRFSPARPLLDEYVQRIMASWRDAGGEPDVALHLPPLLTTHGFAIRSVTPHLFCARPGEAMWRWIADFVEINTARLQELRAWDGDSAAQALAEFRQAERDPQSLMMTPMVLEIVADRVC